MILRPTTRASPHGVVGGENPRASSSPGKQAIVSGVVIVLTVADLKRIAMDAARAVLHKLTGSATKEAVERAAFEAAEKHGSREVNVAPEKRSRRPPKRLRSKQAEERPWA
jgi:hypothetical protein